MYCFLILFYLGWFSISDLGTLNMAAIDREDKDIVQMYKPQVQVLVKAKKTSSPNQISVRRLRRDVGTPENNKWIFAEDLDYQQNTMLINVIIEDENDNAPIFKGESKIVIGYPSSKVAQNIAPPYLVQVQVNRDKIDKNRDKLGIHR